MQIWVDADACPVVIRDIIVRAALRKSLTTTFVANHAVAIPRSPLLTMLQVEKGFDVADNVILQRLSAGDLVITQDIPLAAEVLEKKALAINPRGEHWTEQNIKQRLNIRDFMETMRASGVQTGGPATLNNKDRMTFANTLDRILAKVP